MAWAIRTDGADDQMVFTLVTIPANENFTIRIAASLDDLSNRSFAGQSGAFNNVIRTASASQWKFRANAVESDLNFSVPMVEFDAFDVEIQRTGGTTGTIDIVDTATQSSLLVATVNNPNELALNGLFKYGNSSFRFIGELQLFEITSTTINNKWDATASDHSNTGVQPVLVDTIGTNDATGSGFPTDGSAWVDLGGETNILTYTANVISQRLALSTATAALNQQILSTQITQSMPCSAVELLLEQQLASIDVSQQIQLSVGAVNLGFQYSSVAISQTLSVSTSKLLTGSDFNALAVIQQCAMSTNQAYLYCELATLNLSQSMAMYSAQVSLINSDEYQTARVKQRAATYTALVDLSLNVNAQAISQRSVVSAANINLYQQYTALNIVQKHVLSTSVTDTAYNLYSVRVTTEQFISVAHVIIGAAENINFNNVSLYSTSTQFILKRG
jgi:hypothetical protein